LEIEALAQRACLLEPPGDASGGSQRTTVRLSVLTIDDQPRAPEPHTHRGLRHVPGTWAGHRPRRSAEGIGPEYHESYYGAFVRDPDGNNVEAVCHIPV
jgi:catechol 2,3-dioxygenase-like lactoylglutathione lyase family enzyme